ncbi:glycine/betaine ABC transporter substrate-binding protein [Streptomyces spongiicola]|uniref:Glycine/betaine ABC transporter substrate-binding protein n=1 Tax=Streptomyces spongiicola TaxID=1690221 RepID=A0A2S1YWR8_9ACTN|nr:glycine betaine ABC transporter substrate-binding protein [Streptomyces spongiicola]AWK08539.1 glycine/betaine ABC transporter substrate-binding protein [Streptomyces spongiicola]GBQ03787.1 glycine/betaine ABC transporter substrate-binding protein [Streptomyces spongiicola]
MSSRTPSRASFRTRTRTPLALAASLAAASLVLTACGGGDSPKAASGSAGGALEGASFTVGSKDFSEQIILGRMTVELLEANGADVTDKTNIKGSAGTRKALESGDISMYWEYTGTGWITYLHQTKPIADQRQQFEKVASDDLTKNGIAWIDPPAPLNNTYAFAIREDKAAELGVKSLSDLAALSKDKPQEATFCIESEFSTRDDGFPGLVKAYGINTPKANVKTLDTGLIYTETAKGSTCNFGEVFATDGRIPANKLVVLEDDKHFFPVYQPALTLKQETLEKHPELKDIFAPLAEKLTTDEMQKLNALADVEGEDPEDIAHDWLVDNGFVK